MKRVHEAVSVEWLLPEDLWREILQWVDLWTKMTFSETSSQNYRVSHESVEGEIGEEHFIRRVENPRDIFYIVRLSDEKLSKFYNLRELNLGGANFITYRGLMNLTRLQILNLHYNSSITNEGIRHLTTLTKLNLKGNTKISSSGLLPLANNLTSLNLTCNPIVGPRALLHLHSLKHLKLDYNRRIRDTDLQRLTGITSLSLASNHHLANCLQHMTNLRKLVVVSHAALKDEDLFKLTALENLIINGAPKITGTFLPLMTHLKMLRLENLSKLQYLHISSLTNLTDLSVPYYSNANISDATTITHLKNLTNLELSLSDSARISYETIKSLTNLKCIRLWGGRYQFAKTQLEELPNLKALLQDYF